MDLQRLKTARTRSFWGIASCLIDDMVYDFFDPKAILTHTPFLTLGVQGASTVEPEGQVAHPSAWKESHVFLLESPWVLVQ